METGLSKKAASEQREPTFWINLYTGAVGLAGVMLVVGSLASPPADGWGWLLFTALALLAEWFSVELFSGTRGSRVSVSSIVSLAVLQLFGPAAGVLTHAFVGTLIPLISSLRTSEKPKGGRASWLQRTFFNLGMLVIAIASAGQIFLLAGGRVGKFTLLEGLIPLFAAAFINEFVNLLILIGVLSIQTHKRVIEIWRENFLWALPITIPAGLIGAGGLAYAYGSSGLVGLIVFALPVLATSYSFRMYTANLRVYVTRLEQLNEELGTANMGLMETLSAVIDAYDLYTFGHSQLVAKYAGAIAGKLGLPAHEQDVILKAALIHDVGKVGITEKIIGKNGPLTDEEYNIVKHHPRIGAEIASRTRGLQEMVPLVKYHHERWDGRGYPDGLKGEEIPLGARILAVADTLDALRSDRPYRPTRSFQDAVQEITRCSGNQFDPQVVAAFLALAEEKGSDFFQNSAMTVEQTLGNRLAELGRGVRYLKRGMIQER